ncbi:NAD-dependent epimerase/dehydratase family protein [Spirochaeta cellobiosiphila]|uniref:NAD-dependent epimerase/dehydratase family protein n=1 Tax=Spirochaeta cellobiosiphila TaxID=504483 RepID=UPI000413DFCA|nr:NAD-dependent epimerase/dehydratase family protein [Spirochaeta cellobiosiphila]
MNHTFVTGATGFVGINLVNQLLEQQWKITALHLPQEDTSQLPKHFDLQWVEGNVLDRSSLIKVMPQEEIVIFHLAGDTSMWKKYKERQYNINVLGTRNIVKTALLTKAKKLIYTSSISAYGYHRVRVTETTTSNALTCGMNYNRSNSM